MRSFFLRQFAASLALGSIGFSSAHGQVSAEQVTPALTPVVVISQASSTTSLTPGLDPGRQQVNTRLQAVPGGTNLIEPAQEQRLVTLRDALDYQPGIIVQEFFGGLDQPRLNIRGSGIQSNPLSRGILLMQDGLPLNDADGSFIISLLEPRNAALVSVRRGANALAPGATTLGGEVDFRTFNGSQNDRINLGGGSFDTQTISAAQGFQNEHLDGRLSIGYDKSNGYRHHAQSERYSTQNTLGWRLGNFENRTYFSYTDLKFAIPGVVPKARMYADPRGVLGDGDSPFDRISNTYRRDPHRNTHQFRLANRSYWGSALLNLSGGLYWQHGNDDFTNGQVAHVTGSDTYGLTWQLASTLSRVDYRLALDWQHSDMNRALHAIRPADGSRLQRFADYALSAENRSALLGVDWHISPQISLVGDLKYTQALRNANERNNGKHLDQTYHYATPRLGATWHPAANQRWYTNISRSNEAPTFWEITNGEVIAPLNPASALATTNRLELQRALSYEIGGDGTLSLDEHAQRWSIALYRSHVDDELMSVTNANGTAAGTYNYRGHTRHQGAEAGINGKLSAPGSALFDYRIAYTLSDFRFRDGEFQGKQIAGVPRHLISAEILYQKHGFAIGPNLRWLMHDTQTNHANVPGTAQDAYALFGLKAAYQHDAHWSAYLRADNLSNKTHASSYAIRNTAQPANPTFLPGSGRSFSAGLGWRF